MLNIANKKYFWLKIVEEVELSSGIGEIIG